MEHQHGIQERSLEEVMGERFGRYSKYIIQERALPDIRDGLKPVQRRILYAMYEDGNTAEKAFRKSAKAVGNIMGNYHPHGDSSIYEAMVRMSQDWKVREPLIEMHGNNGSMDGDPAAAMRYTEARLSALSGSLLADIDKETVEMAWNFDDTTKEPTVLPAAFPNLLVNGATGISAGYATEIPTHNLGEVISALIYYLQHPTASTAELMQYLPGPDFPTGGILMGTEALHQAYETGKGKVVLRAKTSLETLKGQREQIVVHELPYEVNKANLVKKIDDLRLQKKVEGIAEVRDETDRDGLRIVIELKKQAASQSILNYLFKNTDLQINYHFNMVAIDEQRPVQVDLKRLLEAYLNHRKQVIRKRSRYELAQKEARIHILEGLIRALSMLDEIIALIRQSENRKYAKQALQEEYAFSEVQAEAILTMPLYRLTNTDVLALEKEAQQLAKEAVRLRNILNQEASLEKVLIKELKDIQKKYASARRTEIVAEVEKLTIKEEKLITSEQTMVAISRLGYVKRSSLRSVQSSGGIDTCGLRQEDSLIYCEEVNTRDMLYLFTNKGKVIYRPVYEISEQKWKEVGDHITQTIINLERDEILIGAMSFPKLPKAAFLVMLTRKGFVKRLAWSELAPWRTYKAKAQRIMQFKAEEDEFVLIETENNEAACLYLFNQKGYALAYPLAEVAYTKAKSSGIKAMNLKAEEWIQSAFITLPSDTKELVTVTQRGAMKRLALKEIPIQKRAQRGVLVLKTLKTKPHLLVYAALITAYNDVLYETSQAYLGRVEYENIKLHARESNGTLMLDTAESGTVTWAQVIAKEEHTEVI